MLVLSRKLNERIQIGDNVWVTVVEIRGDKVRLGIEAPREIMVHREEVALQIAAEGERLEVDRREQKLPTMRVGLGREISAWRESKAS